MTYNCLVKLVGTFLSGITFTVNYYLMRHFLFGKDLYQNSKSQISPILSYYDFFQVGFSIKLMLIFFNKSFIRVIITFKIQVIQTGTTCPSREIHDEITVLFVRDFHSWWRLQRVTHAYCMALGYAILSEKKNNIFNKSWWVLLLQFSLANPYHP